MFKEVIFEINKEINSIKSNKATTMKNSVNKKLERSLDKYKDNALKNAEYIMSRSSYKVMKTIDRIKAKEEKDKLKEEKKKEKEELENA